MAQNRSPSPNARAGAGSLLQIIWAVVRLMLWTLALGAGIALSFKGREIDQLLRIAAGYKAKIFCSAVFVSGRPAESVLAEDLAVDDLWPLRLFPAEPDRDRQTVRVNFLGLVQSIARHRVGQGCVLAAEGERFAPASPVGVSDGSGRLQPALPTAAVAMPRGGATEVISPQLQATLDWGFAEPDPEHLRRTRALLVMQDGKVVAERYAPGFGPDMPLAGWSMAKLALNALVGILVGEGRLKLDAPVNLPEWQNDPRAAITLDQLLRMSSGLEFSEEYGDLLQDVTVMLLRQPSAAAFAAGKPLIYPPGSHWYYASGTSNILSRLIRSTVGDDRYRDL
ncbi:MAG: serine hydrolase, partial [Methylococcaceae bacterium]|nr:serine hydrolase [Methylococcaceae bacterium]